MPTVPQAQRQVSSRVIQGAQVSTDIGLEQFGGGAGLEKITQGVGSLIKGVYEVSNEMDNVEAEKALAEAVKAKNQAMFGSGDGTKGDGYYAKKGKSATTEMDAYNEKIKSNFQQIEDGLSNDRQKAKYRNAVSKMELEISGQMQQHAFGEAQKYDQEETAASLQAHQDDAILNYKELNSFSPEGKKTSKIRSSIERQEQIIKDFAFRQGYGPDSEFTKQKILAAKTATHRGVIERGLAGEEDLSMQAYYEQAKKAGEIDPGAIADLDKLVEAGTLRGDSQRATEKLISSGLGQAEAFREARKLPPKLQDEVIQRLKVRFDEEKAITREQELGLVASVEDHLDTYKSSNTIPVDKMNKLSEKQREAVRIRERNLTNGKIQKNDDFLYSELKMMAANPDTRNKFIAMDLFTDARNRLDDSHYQEIKDLRNKIVSGDKETSKKLDGFLSDNQLVAAQLAQVGIDRKKKPEVYYNALSKIDADVQRWKQDNNRENIPNIELKKITDYHLIEGTVKGTGIFGIELTKTKKRLFQVEGDEQVEIDVNTLPKEDVADIKRLLKRAGKTVDDNNIIKVYEMTRGRKS